MCLSSCAIRGTLGVAFARSCLVPILAVATAPALAATHLADPVLPLPLAWVAARRAAAYADETEAALASAIALLSSAATLAGLSRVCARNGPTALL